MPKEFSRTQRVGDQIQRELATILQLEMKDPRLGMVTVSGVEVSRDMSFATAHVTFLGIDGKEAIEEAVEILTEASGFLRTELARRMRMRFTPQLRFRYDESLVRGRRLSSLIDEARADDTQIESLEKDDEEK
ncbi:30S ribosome-binding factor RbfA [Sansalvadorimonas verongulae]|uniref:30S ribosome-binding factor RbfA n=1 Tax=Sansalvadorimonas verongulae TaxID=2172824 RepID=UPI0012BD5EB8|nr:30S ribosome-binding factor RbfA [Sansalvadorimonas verongulae]MTI15088.1 30S ribosome-binding factor RbfA [Sansalvadorimonas verongulae]